MSRKMSEKKWPGLQFLRVSTTTSPGSAITVVSKDLNGWMLGRNSNNSSGGFCFHTAKTSYHLPLDEAKKGLAMLKEAGMKKVNFSGGEPFLIQGGNLK